MDEGSIGRRRVCVITGSRADYGYIGPLMNAIRESDKLELVPVATGMHLMARFGRTIEDVKADTGDVIEVPMEYRGDADTDMAHYLSCGIKNFADFFSQDKPDIVIVLGDRLEPLSASLACMCLNIPLAHMNGGDVTGTVIDESIRHSITKIAHLHFVFNRDNAERVGRMGEDPWRIHIVGSTSLEGLSSSAAPKKDALFSRYGLDPSKETILVVQHPLTTLKDRGVGQLRNIIQALEVVGKQNVFIYPNCDAGSQEMIDMLSERMPKNTRVLRNLVHADFLGLMKGADLMVGNSSAGLLEAPFLGTPVVNVGSRQEGRARSADIVDVEPESEKIVEAILKGLSAKDTATQVPDPGEGRASAKIVSVLESVTLDERLIQKQISY